MKLRLLLRTRWDMWLLFPARTWQAYKRFRAMGAAVAYAICGGSLSEAARPWNGYKRWAD